MNASKWQKIEEGVAVASEIPSDERARWLDKFCAGDDELKSEIESLLAFETEADGFLETSLAPLVAKILPDDEAGFAGKQFGHYRIIREIGRGGMGAVFLAERADGEFDQQVALKIVRQTIFDKESENRFRRERQILASLNHPNIARLLDGGVSEAGEPFLAMEFIEGETLLEFAARTNLSIDERLRLFLKICAGVAFAHRNLIVHRDIKPANILITKDGEAKLLDFGLAKILDFEIDSAQTATAFRALTPAYASPEQMRGETVTTASDIYSLGVVLYELLTGNRPFNFKTNKFEEIIRHVSIDEPTKPSEIEKINPKSKIQNSKLLEGDLDNIVLMSLRKEPERRYQSVEAFAEDIERYLQNLPVAARSNTFSYRAAKFVKRNKVAVFAAGFIFLAIVSGLFVSLWQAENARRQRDLAQAEKAKAERINKFLQEMLSFSNQSVTSISPVAQKKDVTVNEMLDEIAPQIETELADQPEVRAQVLRTIGSSYASQGRYDSAEKYLRESLKTQTQIYGEDNAETAATMFELGTLAYRQLKFDDANQLLEKSVAFYRRRQQADSLNFNRAKLAQALDSLGTVKIYSGDSKSSAALLNEALLIASDANLQGGERLILASVKTNLGGVLVRLGELDKGEALLRQSLALYNQVSTNPRWEKGATLVMLGELSNGKNQPDEAEKFLIESEQIYRQTLGDKNIYLGYNLYQQALALNQKRDFKNAEAKAREALVIDQAVLPGEHPTLATVMTTLGIILTKAGRAREGEDYLRRALAISQQQPTKNLAFVAQIKMGLSESLTTQNRFAEAEKISLETVQETKQNPGDQNDLTKSAMKNLNEIREKQGKNKL